MDQNLSGLRDNIIRKCFVLRRQLRTFEVEEGILSTLRIFAFNLFFYRLEAINPIHYLFLLASKITRRLQKFGKRQNYIKQLLAIDLIAKTEIIALMSSSMQNNLHEIWRRVRERSGMFYYNFAIGLTSITKTEFHSLSLSWVHRIQKIFWIVFRRNQSFRVSELESFRV